jgi:poly [ADP-ribose] polymerase 1
MEETEVKIWKSEPKDEAELAQDRADEELYASQNKAVHKLGEKLRGALTKTELINILELNKQKVPIGIDMIIERVTDIMTFGALEPCKTCKTGQFVFDKPGYVCSGDLTEWVKCMQVEKDPKRCKCKIPEELAAKYSFLAKYKSKVQKRFIKYFAPSGQYMLDPKKEEIGGEPRIKKERPPLHNMEFVIIGHLDQSKEEIGEKIKKMGGFLKTKIHANTAAIISNQAEVEKMGKRMQEAQMHNIQVVPADYLDDLKASEAISYISSKSICDWGSDPRQRIQVEEAKSKSKSLYTRSVPSTMTVTLKGGLAVDPASGLELEAHVYKQGKDVFNCVLALTDLQAGKNSFYKLQILQSDDEHKFWLFR